MMEYNEIRNSGEVLGRGFVHLQKMQDVKNESIHDV